jgi:hypothetical protein
MQIRYYKQLVKLLFSLGENIGNYQLYWIAKLHFNNRSGIFSINELIDVLYASYNYTSLSYNKGNKRSKFSCDITRRIENSILFEKLSDGRYKYITERKLININKSSVIEGQLYDLQSREAFVDIMIGCIAAGNSFKSYRTISEQTHFSQSRCVKALARLNESQRILKFNNYILVKQAKLLAIQQLRKDLIRNHGIKTPEPIKYNGTYIFCVYAPNSYSTPGMLTASDTSIPSSYPIPYRNVERCRFRGAEYKKTGIKHDKFRKIAGEKVNLFLFNDTNPNTAGFYTFSDYIDEFSKQMSWGRNIA